MCPKTGTTDPKSFVWFLYKWLILNLSKKNANETTSLGVCPKQGLGTDSEGWVVGKSSGQLQLQEK